jgi:hypothetical protein
MGHHHCKTRLPGCDFQVLVICKRGAVGGDKIAQHTDKDHQHYISQGGHAHPVLPESDPGQSGERFPGLISLLPEYHIQAKVNKY